MGSGIGVMGVWRGAVMVLLSVIAGPLPAQGAPVRKIQASLERVYGAGAVADTLLLGGGTVLRIRRAGQVIGFAQVRDVMGKEAPITCLVATDSALVLRDIDVLVYREAYGGEVAYEPWRRQFRGRSPADTLVVGRNIRGISGATISVNAVTLLVRATLGDFARWRGEGRL